MATTSSLLVTHIESSQAQKEITANEAFDAFDSAIAGLLSKDCAGGSDVTLTDAEQITAILKCTGILTANINVIVAARTKLWLVHNATSGVYTLTVKTASGSGILVPQGGKKLLYCDGTDVVEVIDKSYAVHELDATPDADHSYSGHDTVMTIDAGQSPAFGSLLFIGSDGELELADADAAASMPAVYMATGSGTGAQTVVGANSFIRDDSWNWMPGAPLYASGTAGGITATAPSSSGQQVQRIGMAKSATVIHFLPSTTVIEIS